MDENRDLLLIFLRAFHYQGVVATEDDKKPNILWLIQKLNSVAAKENSDRYINLGVIIFI